MAEDIQMKSSALCAGAVLASRYELLHRIATGGTGSVYVAKDLAQSDTKVVVKVLHPTHMSDQSLVSRFVQEARLLNSIDHVNIVKMKDIHDDLKQIFLVTEYIVGQTLGETIDASDRPFEILPGIIEQICEGLKVIHDLGILHRDLKPENILMQTDGVVKIIDFGAARSPKSNLTLAGQLIGTTPYIAPEVWIEKRLTPAVDFYSLGVILYQITTKHLPFETMRTSDLMRLHIKSEPVAPKERVPEIPHWLNHLILKLLVKNPVTRYQRSDQVITFLRRVKMTDFDPTARTTFKRIQPAVSSQPSVTQASNNREQKKGLFNRLLSRKTRDK